MTKTVSPAARFAQTALMLGTLALAGLLISPFLSPLLWAVVLSYALYPLYVRVLRATGQRKTVSALILCTIMTIGLLLPLLYVVLLVSQELAGTVSYVLTYLKQEGGSFGESWRRFPVVAGFYEQFQNLERVTETDLRSKVATAVADLGGVLIQQSTSVVTNLLQGVAGLGIMLLSSFYFFRDGHQIVNWAHDNLPVTPERRRLVLRRFDEVVKGAVYGNTIVAVMEGFIGWLAFWVVGLPSPVLWGAVMAITAYIPFVGGAMVWFPAAVYLGIQGSYGRAAILVGAGIVLSVVVDDLVRNVIVGQVSKLHTLLMFFSVIGGIELFGLIGIVAGPLVFALAVTLLETYHSEEAGLASRHPGKS